MEELIRDSLEKGEKILWTGELKTSVVLMLLVVGSMIPLTAIADGMKAKKLCYAATDRRLMKKTARTMSMICTVR